VSVNDKITDNDIIISALNALKANLDSDFYDNLIAAGSIQGEMPQDGESDDIPEWVYLEMEERIQTMMFNLGEGELPSRNQDSWRVTAKHVVLPDNLFEEAEFYINEARPWICFERGSAMLDIEQSLETEGVGTLARNLLQIFQNSPTQYIIFSRE